MCPFCGSKELLVIGMTPREISYQCRNCEEEFDVLMTEDDSNGSKAEIHGERALVTH